MSRRLVDRALRWALWAAVPLNLFGTALFLGVAAGMSISLVPLDPDPFYAAQLALVIGLFAGAYGWMATQAHVSRPLLTIGAAGKIGFFAIFVIYWGTGAVQGSQVLTASPDLLIGLVFIWWLRTPVAPQPKLKRYPEGEPNRYIVRPLSQSVRRREGDQSEPGPDELI